MVMCPRFWRFVVSVCLLLVGVGLHAKPAPLTVVTDDNFPPFVFRDADGQARGFVVDLWALWSQKTGQRVDLRPMNWAEAQRQLQAGEADVIDMIYRTPAREPLYEFSRPYQDLPVAVFAQRGLAGLTDVRSLRGFQVGVQAGDACAERLKGEGITAQREFRNYADMLDAAERGEVRIFCLDEYPAAYYLHQRGADQRFVKAFVLYTGQFHRAARKGRGELLQRVEAGMDRISPEDVEALRRKWLGTPVTERIDARQVLLVLGGLGAVFALLALWVLLLRRAVTRQTAALESERARMQALFDSLPDLVWLRDPQGVFLACNAAFEQAMGRQADRIIGHRPTEVFEAERAREALETDALVLREGRRVVREESLQDAQGRTHLHETVKAPVIGARGQVVGVLGIARDITERKRLEEELAAHGQRLEATVQERTARLHNLYHHAPCGYHTSDQTGQLTDINDTELRMLGYTREEVIGSMTVRDLVVPGDLPLLAQRGAAGPSEVPLPETEFTFRRKDGSTLPVLVRSEWLREADGRWQVHTVVLDNRERKAHDAEVARLSDELVHRAEQADAANRAKSRFLANMSHEIRTPMNAILGTLHLLQRENPRPDQVPLLERTRQASRHLLTLIGDILDLSRIEAGRMEMGAVPLDPRSVLGDVQSILLEQARAKGLSMRLGPTEDAGGLLLGDPQRLRQALLNLAGNAVKFTAEGSVTLALFVEAPVVDGDAVRLRFEVRDTGPGIDADTLARLFRPFEQGDTSSTRVHGGSGLGLVITRQLARLMGGEAGARSEPGQGSTFWFTVTLPRAPAGAVLQSVLPPETTTVAAGAASPAVPEDPAQALRDRHAGRRILVAEDNLFNQEIARELLKYVNLQVTMVGDGAQAVEAVGAQAFDLVLMDMQMPVLDGVEAARAIRQTLPPARLPIIAMTANAFAEDRQRCLDAGMDDFISKPVEPQQLYALLLRWLERPAA